MVAAPRPSFLAALQEVRAKWRNGGYARGWVLAQLRREFDNHLRRSELGLIAQMTGYLPGWVVYEYERMHGHPWSPEKEAADIRQREGFFPYPPADEQEAEDFFAQHAWGAKVFSGVAPGLPRERAQSLLKILGIEEWPVRRDTLRRTYRRLSMLYHPDRPQGDAVRFREVTDAYVLLTNHLEAQTTYA